MAVDPWLALFSFLWGVFCGACLASYAWRGKVRALTKLPKDPTEEAKGSWERWTSEETTRETSPWPRSGKRNP